MKNIPFIISLFLLLMMSTQSLFAQNLSMSNYQLGSGDSIQINVFGEDDLSLSTMLGDTGIINYPFLGEIKVTGLTVNQVIELITKGLKGDYLINPSVRVSITEYRQFFINGEVENPGGYAYQPGLNVNKAIALAGGMTERASNNGITIIRASDTKQAEIKAMLKDLIYPGDIIKVEESFF